MLTTVVLPTAGRFGAVATGIGAATGASTGWIAVSPGQPDQAAQRRGGGEERAGGERLNYVGKRLVNLERVAGLVENKSGKVALQIP